MHLLVDSLRNAVLITGMVMIMMMTIEMINVSSNGHRFDYLRLSRPRQVLLGALLGLIPGCAGGFAAVSLYSHGVLSFGALVAALVSSSGDESFVMLSTMPGRAVGLFLLICAIGVLCGLFVDLVYKPRKMLPGCELGFELHEEHHEHEGPLPSIFSHRSWHLDRCCWQKVVLVALMVCYITALAFGLLEHEHAHGAATGAHAHGINIFDEKWINLLFCVLSVFVVLKTYIAPDHFVAEHLWGHVVLRHCLKIFLWTLGALIAIELLLDTVDIQSWINGNVWLVLLLAALVGLIPESGPHMIFVMLYLSGAVPFSVLLAGSISQDGHSALPLLAHDKRAFVGAKLLNFVFALAFGAVFRLFGL